MCNYVIQKNASDASWLPKLWTSDEANFNLNGNIIYLKYLHLQGFKNNILYFPSSEINFNNFRSGQL
jgi:hypothetical protein